MAPAFVQSKSAASSSLVSPLVFTNPNTAGNAIIVLVGEAQPSDTFTVSDSQGNTYLSLTAVAVDNTQWQIFYSFGINSGSNTVTFARGSSGPTSIAIHEFSGINHSDSSASATGSGNSQDSGGLTISRSVELLFGFTAGDASANLSSFTAGQNQMEVSLLGNIGVAIPFITQYQITTVSGTYHATSTTTMSKGQTFLWVAEIAGFFTPQASALTDWQLGGRHHSSRIILPGRGLDA